MSVVLMAEAVLRSVSAAGQKGRKAWGVCVAVSHCSGCARGPLFDDS